MFVLTLLSQSSPAVFDGDRTHRRASVHEGVTTAATMSTTTLEKPSPRAIVALAWINGFNNRNLEAIGDLLSDKTYTHEWFPKSMGIPSLGKADWLSHGGSAMKLFKEWKVELIELIDAGEKIVLHVRSDGLSTTGAKYKNEYIFTLSFDETESGELKICYVKEFVDSIVSKEFFPAEMERQARLSVA